MDDDDQSGLSSKRKKEDPGSSSGSGEWIEISDDVFYRRFGSPSLPSPTSVIGFDMDGTIITTKSGKKFAQSASDWVFLYESIPEKLKTHHSAGAYLLLFTNQGGIAKDSSKAGPIKQKITTIMSKMDIPMDVIIAGSYDNFRKPSTGMWDFIERTVELEGLRDVPKTFVGDAAGRPVGWDGNKKTKKDFSCTDRKFALNLGWDFKTPEEFFLGRSPAPFHLGFEPSKVGKQSIPDGAFKSAGDPEMVVFVGFPASGKSSFYRRHYKPRGYDHVNRDTLKTMPKCKASAKSSLEGGKSVVIDNTNPSVSARSEFTSLAESLGVPCRCIWFQTPREIAEHMNILREKQGGTKRVPQIAYNMFKSKFQEPSKQEGFSSVVKVEFGVDFDSEEKKKEFCMFTE
eukprot:CAMPEP_0201490512 /NCGR_PEP_ID=MMETSP0151_2-20130828/26603_1 /ASSEMBLY_ACC=CAM_ASM_000257 /TAXON_ID=200890 /ORGANISM="Paramoeba atlantica, Strain 621/1 / CCAP 1560/9" /LENGTH=399 /DNA_ID=CAMNT_0047876501 /DNA_START=84 /DNA_END=1283 /DNA_ORIENTATION=-